MTETKWTPGPWQALFEQGLRADFYHIRSVEHPDWRICTGPNWANEHTAENIANAHLIAAAPDLYEALEAAIATDMTMDRWVAVVRDAKAALSRARGEG